MVQFAGRFVAEDPVLRVEVPQALMAEIKANQTEIKPNDWVPREKLVKIYQAIVDTHRGDEQRAHTALLRCGAVMGGFATNTFLKLLLKMLTPQMFARKFPDFWARDHQRGRIEVVSVEEKGMVMLFNDMEGYDHFGPVATGWAGSTLKVIGVKKLVMKLDPPWSIAQPTAKQVRSISTWE